MKLLPDDICSVKRIADPSMLLLGIHVGYLGRDSTATPQQTAFCRAIVRALISTAYAGGYPQSEVAQAVTDLLTSHQPLVEAQAICDCITPDAWKAAMLHPDFDSVCRI